jgi:hypothetical protein
MNPIEVPHDLNGLALPRAMRFLPQLDRNPMNDRMAAMSQVQL